MPERPEDAHRLAADVQNLDRGIDARVWPEAGDPEEVEMIVAWRQPQGLWSSFPNLRLVASFGAGVESLVGDADLPANVAVVRTVDGALAHGMAEYVVTAIADWRRGWTSYRKDQDLGRWRPRSYSFACTVLVLGMGRMGSGVVRSLEAVGHRVLGWRRSGKALNGVEGFSGRSGLEAALPEADVVVCLLPLTPDTEGLLEGTLFSRMKKDSLLINVGRGAHLVEEDLIPALESGRPGHAVLDVFRREPLPEDHPFWKHPCITITPHVAALTDPKGAAERIVENWRRLQSGETLVDLVDRGRGY
jgi:glyoxylate/hydroxypyruvate reductase A